MQVPEKLSLIGGSILLASTLVFTLKGQASSILPKIDSGMSTLMKSDKERQDDQQKQQQEQAFDNDFQRAQQNHWQTGQWGTAKYYIDNDNNFHVGSGQLSGALEDTIGQDKLIQINTINLDGTTQAPQNSQNLFGLANGNTYNTTTSQINGLSKLDTSQVTDMSNMFANDKSLSNLDLTHFDTSKVTNMNMMFSQDISLNNLDLSNFDTSQVTNVGRMFEYNTSLSNLNLSHFDTSNVNNMGEMFEDDSSLNNLDLRNFNTSNVTNMYGMFYNDSSLTLSNLDLSNFDTSKITSMDYMFYNDNIHQLSLGSNTKLQNNSNKYGYNSSLSGIYQSNGQTLSLDGNAHPGTWTKQ